ncbi:MAG: B12-binding domain-containing radical SAM protein [Firmicutes bacterium]|nr:B12-binding domain-containing radical SAM protein [Bacillota bacterium]
MKVLLTGCVRKKSQKSFVSIPKLGLGYIATSLRKAGHDVLYLDCQKENMEIKGFKEYLKLHKPDAIGLQVPSCDFSSALQMTAACRETLPRSKVIAGGPHISATGEEALKALNNADFAFHGEAENGMVMLLNYLEGKKDSLDKIPGLIYRHEDGIRVNKACFPADIDSLGFPSWDLLKPESYLTAPHGAFFKQTPAASIITTRGCPYSCAYCSVKFNTGNILRKRSIPHIMEEIKLLRKEHGIKEIHIEDDNFTFHRAFVEEFCLSMMKENPGITWALPNGIRLDTIDENLLKLMEKAGCYSTAVGIESGSPRILSEMNRSVTLEKMIEKVNLISSSTNIRITGAFILGFPAETHRDLDSTIDLAVKLPLNRAYFGLFMPYPGTEVFQSLVLSGKLDPKKICWDICLSNMTIIPPDEVSKKELRSYRNKAYWKFYSRPKIFLPILKEIRLKNLPNIVKRIVDSFF